MAIELIVPVPGLTMYGLLGAVVVPSADLFTIEIASTSGLATSFDDTMASKKTEDVRCGLLKDYASAVKTGMREATQAFGQLPAAKITCDVAAHGLVGSNEVIFARLAKALVHLLLANAEPTKESIAAQLQLP